MTVHFKFMGGALYLIYPTFIIASHDVGTQLNLDKFNGVESQRFCGSLVLCACYCTPVFLLLAQGIMCGVRIDTK